MRIEGWFDFADAAFPPFAGLMLVASAAIIAAGLMSLGLKRRADLRHAVWLSALAVVLLSPGLIWLGDALRLPTIAPPRFISTMGPAENAPLEAAPVEPAPRGGARPQRFDLELAPGDAPNTVKFEIASTSASPARSWTQTARAVVVPVWLLGSLGLLVRLIHGCRRVVQIQRGVRPLPSAVEAILPRVAAALGVSAERLPTIGVSDEVTQPATLGLVRPLALIPEGLAERLSGDELRDVLVHECAHALRRDAVVGLLQRLATVVCWPNPLVLVMNRALESAREDLCDNHVLRASNPADYAASLLKVALMRPHGGELDALLGLPFIARRGALEDRVKGLVDPLRNPSTAAPRVLTFLLAFLFLASSAAVAAIRLGDDDQAPAASKTRVEGRVVDGAGDPVAGAVVRAWTGVGWLGSALETRSGPDGRYGFDLDELPPGVAVQASTADGSLLSTVAFATFTDPAVPIPRHELILGPTREFTARVTNSWGDPVADAVVEAGGGLPSEPGRSQRTNERGEARLRVLADAELDEVIAVKPGVGFDCYQSRSSPTAEGPLVPPERVELVLNGATTVKVKLVGAGGKPAPGVSLTPLWVTKAGKATTSILQICLPARVTTDENGIAVFDYLPADLSQPVEFATTAKSLCFNERPRFDPMHPETMLTARVFHATPVTGRVLTADEKPAPGVLIQAEGHSPDFDEAMALARTAADGSYRLDLPPNRTYSIGVVDDQRAALTRVGIVPREARPLNHIDFHLEEGTIIRGRVTNKATSEPVADHGVELFELGGAIATEEDRPSGSWDKTIFGLRRWTRTDRDGRYSFRVAQGSFYSPAGYNPWSKPFEVIDQAEIAFDFAVEAVEPAVDRE